jgi:hypothetical protein
MHDGLKVKRLLSGTGMPRFMEELRPKTLRLALERPLAWEYLLFFQSWVDEVELRSDKIREYKEGLKLVSTTFVKAEDTPEWFLTRFHELECWVEAANCLLNESVQEAMGKPGEPGNAEHIVWISRMFGIILDQLIEWASKVRCIRVESPFDKATSEGSLLADDLISQIQNFPKICLQQVEEAIKQTKKDEPIKLTFTMKVELANISRFNEVIAEAKRHFGIN